MLLDNKEKVVESFMENLIAGSVTGNFSKVIEMGKNKTQELEAFTQSIDSFEKWYNYRVTGNKGKEYLALTDWIFSVLLRGRSFGIIHGVFKEIPELEHALAECKEDNIELSRVLKEQGRIIATYEAKMFEKK